MIHNLDFSRPFIFVLSYIKPLKTLIMKQNRNHDITDLGAQYISRLKNIDSLDVANTGITDQGLTAVSVN